MEKPDQTEPAASGEDQKGSGLHVQHRRILEIFETYGNMTDRTLIQLYRNESTSRNWGSFPSDASIRTRRRELVDRGLVADTGSRRRGMPGGRWMTIWGKA